MKEATGEVSMTVVTLVAIGVIGAILAFMWPTITNSITRLWGHAGDSACNNVPCPDGQTATQTADGNCICS